MNTTKRLLITVLLLSAVLSGCGLKGDLYLEEPPADEAADSVEDSEAVPAP